VNESGRRFTVVGNTIRFGLSAVKNVGENTVEAIQAAREEGGPSPTSSTSASG
jgi:DNA polymerase-3 subunit alpha